MVTGKLYSLLILKDVKQACVLKKWTKNRGFQFQASSICHAINMVVDD